jgi:hypothetical protein
MPTSALYPVLKTKEVSMASKGKGCFLQIETERKEQHGA